LVRDLDAHDKIKLETESNVMWRTETAYRPLFISSMFIANSAYGDMSIC
jgi:hypothetical protein